MPTKEEMRADIIKRIVNIRKTKEQFYTNSEVARKIMSDWAMGGAKPSIDIINEASFIIQIADNAAIVCFDQEEALRKLAKDKDIEL